MKSLLSALLGLGLTWMTQAQQPVDDLPPARLTRDELKELTGPIALYPDPLVALILPASTCPTDIVMAARFVASGDDFALLERKSWDDSVKGLTRYPEVLSWMDENLEWTTQLGDAYLAQPEDVMDAIQDLRAQANALGNLADTPQQRIVHVEERIRIVPADPQYIYVPQYAPEVIYYERPVAQPLLTFSLGYLVGSWLRYDFDWHHRRLYCGDWHRQEWDYHHDHDRNRSRGDVWINNSITNYRAWGVDDRRRSAAVKRVATTVQHGVAGRQISGFLPESLKSSSQTKSGHSDHGPRFSLPKPKPSNVAMRESVRRATVIDGGRTFITPTTKPSRDDHDGKGRVITPKGVVPTVKNDDKRDDRKPRSDDKPPVSRGPTVRPDIKKLIPMDKPPAPRGFSDDKPKDKPKNDSRPSFDTKPKPRSDSPRFDIKDLRPSTPEKPKVSAPERREMPKSQVITPPRRDPPKPQTNAPSRRDPPKPQTNTPTRKDSPKPQMQSRFNTDRDKDNDKKDKDKKR